jgi:hypothetical protein
MIAEIQSLMDRYLEWLRDKSQLRAVGDCVEVTTPYLDRHNDYLQFYVKRENGHYLLTDEGYTIQDLQLSGCNLESRKRQDLLRLTLNGFGVQLDNDALIVRATPESFSLRKHNLVQAMLAVNDLFYLATPAVTSLFLEDAMAWLEANDIRYVSNIRFPGKSGYDHRFDFAIPKSRLRPERLMRAINRPDRDSAEAMAFAWVDTKETRPEGSEAYALLNDSESRLLDTVLEALKSYDVYPIAWSEREKFKERLVA